MTTTPDTTTTALVVGDRVHLPGQGDGEVRGTMPVDSFRYGRRHFVIVNLDDGRRFEVPASELRLLEGQR